MSRIEEEFRRETPARSASAPIAHVAAETADAYEPGTPDQRADRARDGVDAQKFRDADAAGLLIIEVPIDKIAPLSMQRDRTVLDQDAMDELEYSIKLHGIRLPIEVFALPPGADGKQYGLLSGYRRLVAQQNLSARTSDEKFRTIRAVLRDPDEMGGAFVAMVEENEIRQDLSHYERGRIAAIAAQQVAFDTTETAVAQMFAAASKAKRSKIRSFAMIFEELGDMLEFPEAMREKDGLRLAQALRNGAEARLREVLGAGQGRDAKSEWSLIEKVLTEQSKVSGDPRRGGRPKAQTPKAEWLGGDTLSTSTGITMRRDSDSQGFVIRFTGNGVTADLMESIMLDIRDKLERS